MKISELIKELNRLLEEHGDVYTGYVNTCCCYGDWEEDPDPVFVNGQVML